MLGRLSVAAILAKAADFRASDGDFDLEIAGNLRFQILVKLGFEFTDFSAAHACDVNVIARAVAFVIMAMAAQMEKIEFVDKTVIFEKVHRAIDRDPRDIRIDLLRAFENFFRVHVARGALKHFDEHHALAGEANAARLDLTREMAGRLVLVDAFAGGRTMREGNL